MATLDEDVFFSTAVELNRRWRAREFSAVELARAFCDRLDRLAPRYNALALPLRDDAMQAARRADKDLKRDRTRGPLQAVPCAVKDVLSVAHRPTVWGARPFLGQVFDRDAAAVSKLAKAGSVLIAKLAMVQLAGGGGYRYAAASLNGPGRNPWDPERWSGGSSSGSGSAVAAGLVPFALGSETNGSIVTPSAFCGITGLRPTYGLVSRSGAMTLSWTLDKIGPMAHSAEDCGHVLAAIAGGDSSDAGSARKSFHFAPQYARAPKELRLGYAPADFAQYASEPLRRALADGLRVLKEAGIELVEVELPDLPYGAVIATVISAEAATVFADLIRDGRIRSLDDARQAAGLSAGLEIPAVDYLQAMRVRRTAKEALNTLFTQVDAIVAPARYSVAPPIGEPLDQPTGAVGSSQGRGTRAITSAGNLAGLPALVLPCGFTEGSGRPLPVALCITGRPFSENTLLRIGIEFQALSDWHRRRPVV